MYTRQQFEADCANHRFRSMDEAWRARQRVDKVCIIIDAEVFRSRSRGGEFTLQDPYYNLCVARHGSPPGVRMLRSRRGSVWLSPDAIILKGSISTTPSGELVPSADFEMLVRHVPLRFATRCGFKIYDPPWEKTNE